MIYSFVEKLNAMCTLLNLHFKNKGIDNWVKICCWSTKMFNWLDFVKLLFL